MEVLPLNLYSDLFLRMLLFLTYAIILFSYALLHCDSWCTKMNWYSYHQVHTAYVSVSKISIPNNIYLLLMLFFNSSFHNCKLLVYISIFIIRHLWFLFQSNHRYKNLRLKWDIFSTLCFFASFPSLRISLPITRSVFFFPRFHDTLPSVNHT